MLPLIKKFDINKNSQNKVLIISSVHGDEQTPLRTIYLLNDYITKEKENGIFPNVGKITTVIGVNHTGLKNVQRNLVPDNHKGDLNRMFNDDYDFDTYKELKQLIDEHNIVIDVHSSPRVNEFVLIDIDGYTDFVIKWMKKSNVDYACRYAVSNGTIKKYCFNNGKVGVTVELTGLERIDFKSASKGEMMIINLLDNINFEMKENFKIPYDLKYINEIYEIEEVKAGCEGILLEKFQGGSKVKKGTILAEVVDYEMNPLKEVIAKYDAFIVSMPLTHYVMPNTGTYTLMRLK